MKISQIVEKIKSYYQGTNPDGSIISEENTRDQILFGNPETNCSGIIVTCFASYGVIERAIDEGVNLIICHEALFWNHGDRTDWLEGNSVFQKKLKILKDNDIVIWRNHDYIHSGILINDKYVDGIFYGLMQTLDWEKFVLPYGNTPLEFSFPSLSVEEIANQLKKKLNLSGIRLVGSKETKVNRLLISEHIMGGDRDKDTINRIEDGHFDAIIPLEIIDYTVSEYVRDATLMGNNKVVFSAGHFNLEEFGMAYMIEYLPDIIGNGVSVSFVQSGDSFSYL